MHIPDGYLSPQTALATYSMTIPFFWRATHRLEKSLRGKTPSTIAIFSALSFVIMMFNIPLPGGTTGHAVGSAIAAIVLGPWAGMLSIAMALVIQALFFGDGGILSLGANILTMAIAMNLTASFVFKVFGGKNGSITRKTLAAIAAGYISINIAAFLTGILLGIQPLLFHTSNGQALYFPYPLGITLPAMMLGHLTIAGWAEAIVTGGVFSWLVRVYPRPLGEPSPRSGVRPKRAGVIWIILIMLVVLTPLGLLAPGTAWGEWNRGELEKLGLGYVPKGFLQFENIWKAPFSGYSISFLSHGWASYLGAAILGTIIIILLFYLLLRIISWFYRQSRSHSSFIEKTIIGFSNFYRSSVTAEVYQKGQGWAQALDPRTKLIAGLVLLLAISITHSIGVLLMIYALLLFIASASKIPLSVFVKRVWFVLPFFTGILVLPIIFNTFTPGKILIPIINFSGGTVGITDTGLKSAIFFLLRVGISVSVILLIMLTTSWMAILKSLRTIGIPAVFVSMLGMTYRYITVFIEALGNLIVAKKSREVGRISAREERMWLAGALGQMFLKSAKLSDDVALAMESRGFGGEIRIIDDFRFRQRDYLVLGITVIIFITIITVI